MAVFTETLHALVLREHAFVILALAACFLLLPLTTKMWWLHLLLTPILAAVAYVLIPKHSLALEIIIIATAVFPKLCHDFQSNDKVYIGGILWFSIAAILAAVMLATPEPLELKDIINPNIGTVA